MGDPITLTNTCKSFDCASYPLRISSNPDEITCSSSECTPAECCTEAVAPPLNVRNVVLGVEIMVAFVIVFFITKEVIDEISPGDHFGLGAGDGQIPVAIWIFAFISWIMMVWGKITARNNENDVVTTSPFFDDMVYFMIVVMSYTFCISYLCLKVRKGIGEGDMVGGNVLSDLFKKNMPGIEGPGGTGDAVQTIILIGLLLVIINMFTNLFLYLKERKQMEKDSVARSIYRAQIVVLSFMVLTLVFVAGYTLVMDLPSNKGWIYTNTGQGLKMFILVGIIIMGAFSVQLGVAGNKKMFEENNLLGIGN